MNENLPAPVVETRLAAWGVHVHPLGISFDQPLTDDQYAEVGDVIYRAEQTSRCWFAFALGDWINAIPWGDRKREIASRYGENNAMRFLKFGSLAKFFPIDLRDKYPAITTLTVWEDIKQAPTDLGNRLLREAQSKGGKLSRQYIKDSIAAERFPIAPPEPPKIHEPLQAAVSAPEPANLAIDYDTPEDTPAESLAVTDEIDETDENPYSPVKPVSVAPEGVAGYPDVEAICIPSRSMAQLRQIAHYWTVRRHRDISPEDYLVSLIDTLYDQLKERA